MKHSGTFTINTPRLILRRFCPEDRDDMLKNWCADPSVQFEYGEPVYDSPQAAGELLDKYISGYDDMAFYRWAIVERSGGENIGMIAFCRVYEELCTAEIEYCIGSAFWGHGYAGEALAAVIAETFRCTGFTKLEAYHRAENQKSGRVLEKSEMHVTDNVERFRLAGEKPVGEVCYCIMK